jgi:cation transport ATPase
MNPPNNNFPARLIPRREQFPFLNAGHPTSNIGSDTGLRHSQAQHSSLQFSARSFSSMAASFSFAGLVSEIANRQPGMMMLISLGIIVAFGTSLAVTLGFFGGRSMLGVWSGNRICLYSRRLFPARE